MSYLLDANVFISAKNLHYGLDFCPAFWEWLIHGAHTGTVFSIDKVRDEIEAGGDELSEWARGPGQALFHRTHGALAPQLGQVSNWTMAQQYPPAATNIFLQGADYYLLAHALAGEHTVVTHEVGSPSLNRIKIPNVCLGLGVRFMTPYRMLSIERARFVLELAA